MITDRLIAIYYPDAYIANTKSLTAYSLYFDEIHLVTFSDGAKDPTSYLASLPDQIYVNGMGDVDQEQMQRVTSFYQFAMNNRELIGRTIFYEPHLLCSKIGSLTEELFRGGLDANKLFEFIAGQSTEQRTIDSFLDKHPNTSDDILIKVAPTALHLAKQNGWLLVSDKRNFPIPYFSNTIRNAEQLSSILAEECLTILLPEPSASSPEEILEMREKLSDQLMPFRNMMLKASRLLREQIEHNFDETLIRAEAEFFVKTSIVPAVAELERRIKLERGKVWRKMFGKAIGWIPIAANAFLAPSPDNIYKAISKASEDIEGLLLTEHDVSILRDPGIAFLLKSRGL